MLQRAQLEGTPLMESPAVLEDAILRTLLHADTLDFPLIEAELDCDWLRRCSADSARRLEWLGAFGALCGTLRRLPVVARTRCDSRCVTGAKLPLRSRQADSRGICAQIERLQKVTARTAYGNVPR
jgi:hypothetical protein